MCEGGRVNTFVALFFGALVQLAPLGIGLAFATFPSADT
jgi:hypothetical protein